MTTPELSGYKFETFQEGGEVFARPVNGTLSHYSTIEYYESRINWRKENTYPTLNLPAGQTVEGSELEVVWQFYYQSPDGFKWGDCYTSTAKEMTAQNSHDVRIALRHKSTAQQNDTNVALLEETVEQAAETYAKSAPGWSYGLALNYAMADFKAGAAWQSQQSQSETIKAVLEYVCQYGEAKALRDDSHSIYEVIIDSEQIMALQSDIEKQLKKQKDEN